jgi:DNA-binding CsgD family transcriptional regulator
MFIMFSSIEKITSLKKVVILLVLMLHVHSYAQIKSKGIHEVINYTSKTYTPITSVWSITQDQKGIIYIGSTNGCLIYDGNTWSQFASPNNSIIRSVMASNNNRIYMGMFNEFGYIEPDETGKLTYHSIQSKKNINDIDFGDIWRIYQIGNKVFFQGFSHLFVYENNTLKTIFSENGYQFSFLVNNKLFVDDNLLGLQEYVNDELKPVPLADKLKDFNIWYMLPYTGESSIIVTALNGLYIYDKKSIKPWDVKVSDKLKKSQVYSAKCLGNNYYVIGTVQDGVYIIDKQGNIIQHITKKQGLQSNTIHAIFIDKQNNLWLGSDYGIDYIPISSPVTWYDYRNGIQGSIYSILINSDVLYVGTNTGLYYSDWGRSELDKNDFTLVDETKGPIWTIYPFYNNVLCGHNDGTFLVNKSKATKISNINGGWKFWEDPAFKNIIFEGTYSGLLAYETNKTSISFKNRIFGFNESSRIVELDNDGYIWVSHPYKGMFRFKINKSVTNIENLYFWEKNKTCPQNMYVYKLFNNICFTARNSIYKFNGHTFDIYPELDSVFDKNGQVQAIKADSYGNIWYFILDRIKMLKKTGDGYIHMPFPELNKLNNMFNSGFEQLYPFDSANILIATTNGLAHFNPYLSKNKPDTFHALIREVRNTRSDSTMYWGYEKSSSSISKKVSIPFSSNALHFKFSCAYYEMPDKIKFKYRLLGYDNEWSSWTTKNDKEYTNLWEGSYQFEVVAQNFKEQESIVASYSFTILPPWYRSKYAYFGYLILFVLLIWLVLKIIEKSFEKERVKLEQEKVNEIKKRLQEHEQEKLKAEKEIIHLKNEMLQAEMERKNSELASIAVQISVKNEALMKVLTSLQSISPKVNAESRKHIEDLVMNIQGNMQLDDDWERFVNSFDKVHENFLQRLKQKYPELTTTDLKLCAYLRMKLSTKEIAALMNISIRGVEKARYRLRKKIDIGTEEDLADYLTSVVV